MNTKLKQPSRRFTRGVLKNAQETPVPQPKQQTRRFKRGVLPKPKQPTRRQITGKIPEETPVLKPKQLTRRRITGKIPEELPVPEAKPPTRRFQRGVRKDAQETPAPPPPANKIRLQEKTTVRASSEPDVSVKHTIDEIIKASNLPQGEQALLPAHRLTTKAARPKNG